MNFIVATQSTWFLIGWICKPLGWIMNWLFEFLNWIGIPNLGLAIILFTIVIKALMIPMSIKQQKTSKLQSVMAPELKLIQDKYKGKTDQASMVAQQEETRQVYEKYGTSALGGCLQLLIQMPILFALYQVIYKMPGYITKLKELFSPIADKLMGIEGWNAEQKLIELAKANGVGNKAASLLTEGNPKNYVIDMMYNLDKNEWTGEKGLLNMFNNSDLSTAYANAADRITQYNSFLGFDLAMSPWQQMTNGSGIWWVIFVPLLAGLLQFLSTKLAQVGQPQQSNDDENPMASSMKLMNYIFPIISVVFCFTFPSGLGIYWVASSGVQLIIQLIVNAYMNHADINEMVKKNVEKANVKRIKRGLKPIKVQNVTQTVRILEEEKKQKEKAEQERKEIIQKRSEASTEYYEAHRTAKKGSLAEKAGMVQQYEERMKAIKAGKNTSNTEKKE